MKDHVNSLTDYLVFYCKVTREDIDDPKMIDLIDDGMLIRYKSIKKGEEAEEFVPFDPPLKDLEGIRPIVIEMAKRAAGATSVEQHES